jgi:hypothetical protein
MEVSQSVIPELIWRNILTVFLHFRQSSPPDSAFFGPSELLIAADSPPYFFSRCPGSWNQGMSVHAVLYPIASVLLIFSKPRITPNLFAYKPIRSTSLQWEKRRRRACCPSIPALATPLQPALGSPSRSGAHSRPRPQSPLLACLVPSQRPVSIAQPPEATRRSLARLRPPTTA